MPISTILTVVLCLVFLLWWQSRLRAAEMASVRLMHESRLLVDSHPRRPAAAFVGVTFIGALLIVAILRQGQFREAETACWPASSVKTVQLRDGSSVGLTASSRLSVRRDLPDNVELELSEGSASFDVEHVRGRSFNVYAGLVIVRVVGTQFDVSRIARIDGEELTVSVRRGAVAAERTDLGETRSLIAGETWTTWIPTGASTAGVELRRGEPPGSTQGRQNEPEPQPRALASDHSPVGSPAATCDLSGGRPIDRSDLSRPAHRLFAQASVARRAGLMRESADCYEELVRVYPRDSRTGLSAFELGRIRMDALDDARGAAQAFTDALRLSPHAGFREDALARLAIAEDALGDRDSCRAVRERYESEFANGVHSASLAALCGYAAP